MLDRANPEMLDRTVVEPVDPTTAWVRPGVRTADPDLLRTHDGTQSCQGSPDVTVVAIDWPLDAPPDGQDVRRYVRDPDARWTPAIPCRSTPTRPCRTQAEYTGYNTDASDLFIDPATADSRIYIVTLDRVEQWLRLAAPALECD